MSLPYLDKNDGLYEASYHRIFDMLKEYEDKLTYHTHVRPTHRYEYIHPRYTADTVQEVPVEWGNCQHDAWGAIVWGVGMGIKQGKKMLRDQHDHTILQKLVGYLECVHFWEDADNGAWEEWREVHTSSVGACVAGLEAVKDTVFVHQSSIDRGRKALGRLFPHESGSRPYDLIQLSMVYPFNVLTKEESLVIIKQIEQHLLRSRGVARYLGDSYYSTLEEKDGRNLPLYHYYGEEAEWVMGYLFLSLSHLKLGNISEAERYLNLTDEVMLSNGALPELYYATSEQFNENHTLGWNSALYILTKEAIDKER